MIPALLGIIAPSFAPVIISTTSSQLIAIPRGASTLDVYAVAAGGNGVAASTPAGDPFNGAGGDGGSCQWSIGNSVAGHTQVYAYMPGPYAAWDASPISGGSVIPATFTNAGGTGGAGAGPVGGVGGGAATEIAPGGSGLSGGLSVTTGSVLAGYVGHGGGSDANGVGWGAGGGGGTYFTTNTPGAGGPAGVLLIFK